YSCNKHAGASWGWKAADNWRVFAAFCTQQPTSSPATSSPQRGPASRVALRRYRQNNGNLKPLAMNYDICPRVKVSAGPNVPAVKMLAAECGGRNVGEQGSAAS